MSGLKNDPLRSLSQHFVFNLGMMNTEERPSLWILANNHDLADPESVCSSLSVDQSENRNLVEEFGDEEYTNVGYQQRRCMSKEAIGACSIAMCIFLTLCLIYPLSVIRGISSEKEVNGMAPLNSTIKNDINHVQKFIKQLILEQLPSIEAELLESSAPEGKAFRWTCQNFAKQHESYWITLSSRIHLLQQYSLVSLFYATGGHSWKRSDRWLESNNECEWHGVKCGGISWGASRHNVLGVTLGNNGLNGTIPSSVACLSGSLSILDLSNNYLTGSLVSELGCLKELKTLRLEDNKLSNAIPASIGGMKKLKRLHLSNNHFSSYLPKELKSLSMLQYFLFHNNNFVGEFPLLPKGLLQLDGSNNNLSGTLPTTSTSLEILNVANNMFRGSLPTEVGRLQGLKTLNLANNYLWKQIPTEIGIILPGLQQLNLSQNLLNGSLSWQVPISQKSFSSDPDIFKSESASQLKVLDLSSNFLTGDLKAILPTLDRLVLLNVSNNLFSGAFPFLPSLNKLESLDLSRNRWIMKNVLPHPMFANRSLTLLHTTIPRNIGSLSRLTTLNLQNIQFTGSIPAEIGLLTRLKELRLDRNALEGRIPSSFGQLSVLEKLNMSFNIISGPVPSEIGKMTKLEQFELAHNKIIGPLPQEIGSLTKLRRLALGHVKSIGSIPRTISRLSSLEQLLLQDSGLSGSIPTELWSLRSLEKLELAHNRLSGSITRSFRELPMNLKLTALDLNDNLLTGLIPSNFFIHMKSLEFLDLLNNTFNGSIPKETWMLSSLRVASLGHNSFSGSIPPAIVELSSLLFLDLSMNFLTGSIPTEIGTMRELSELRLEINLLTGTIPTELAMIPKLEVVQLSRNSISGSFPACSSSLFPPQVDCEKVLCSCCQSC